MLLHEEYQRYNVFRRPYWRWERVLSLTDAIPPKRSCRSDDMYVRAARNFLLRYRANLPEHSSDARSALYEEIPGLYYAYEIFEKTEEEPEPAMFIQARLLAGQDYGEIAAIVDTLPETVEWYCKLFFDVKDHLHKRDWITKHALLPAMIRNYGPSSVNYAGNPRRTPVVRDPAWVTAASNPNTVVQPFLDATLKFFAYFGGKHLVDFMTTGFRSGKPLNSPDDLETWLSSQSHLSVRRRSAQAALVFDVTKYNVMELLATHNQIAALDKQGDDSSKNQTPIERNIESMMQSIPWCVGNDHPDPKLVKYDTGASELRDDELFRIQTGQTVVITDAPDRLPPPSKQKFVLDSQPKGDE